MCDAMHEVQRSFKQKTHPKISINTQQFRKTPKPRSKYMKCMNNERKRDHTKWFETRKSRKSCGLKVLREKRVFGRWKGMDRSREIEKMRIGSQKPIYKCSVILDRSRCREVSRKVSSFKGMKRYSYRVAIQRCPQQKQARWIEELSSSYWGDKNFLDGLRSYWEAVEIAIKGSSRGVEEMSRLLKNSFSRREKHRHECN